ncbi:hypothetical protein PSm6_50260 [Pseudomonas solani]|uniref:Uncharacterized protein n=1 Tax=Pseudomonas solani TaxID=2731552 RepID=A0ABM7LGA4_9PSED|nr:hypothetical protein PSm6_50260 [Pseudomonas solani]
MHAADMLVVEAVLAAHEDFVKGPFTHCVLLLIRYELLRVGITSLETDPDLLIYSRKLRARVCFRLVLL